MVADEEKKYPITPRKEGIKSRNSITNSRTDFQKQKDRVNLIEIKYQKKESLE